MEMSLGKEEIIISNSVVQAKNKLERSIATKANLDVGHIISEDDLHLLSPGDGFRWSNKNNIIGKKIIKKINKNEIIYKEFLSK